MHILSKRAESGTRRVSCFCQHNKNNKRLEILLLILGHVVHCTLSLDTHFAVDACPPAIHWVTCLADLHDCDGIILEYG